MELSFFEPVWIAYFIFVTALLGLVMGSFCNAWAWRIVNNEKISKGRSHCTSCGHVLGVLDLIPVFSWLFLKGKCRYCGSKISARYPLTEIISCIWYVAMLLRYGITLDCIRLCLTGSCLLATSLVDIDSFELPDGFTIAIAVLAMLKAGVHPEQQLDMVIGALMALPLLLIVLIMDKIKQTETMGGGDIKLLAALGLHFGWKAMLFLLISACIIGLAFAALTRKGKETAFPFGPMLAAAAFFTAVFGDIVINAYLELFI